MLFWTPILEYIKIRPSPISKLSPDAQNSTITWAMLINFGIRIASKNEKAN